MSFAPGTRIGSYRILSPLGAGGMGEVYRAQDRKLGREVAIKILPPHLQDTPSARARFEREARAVAALSHPNVLAIFEFGTDRGLAFAVTELLVGQTLRERLEHGPLPGPKVIDYGCQIAKGLAAAHQRGIIHRDLKPENVFVTRDGVVKLLDFGLARHEHGDVTPGAPTGSVSFRSEPGLVLGTVGYMSPEQVRGEPADARADIFSLGTVLYELLTGQPAFKRSTTAETMTAVLKEEPGEIKAAGTSAVASTLERIVLRCLEKRPENRFQSAGDLAFYFESLMHGSVAESVPLAPVAARPRRRLTAIAAAFLLLATVGAYLNRGTVLRWLPSAGADVESVAVMQDDQPGTPADVEYVGRRLVDSLTDRLSQLPRLSVLSQTSMARFHGQLLDLRRIRTDVGADAVVVVGVGRSGGGYEVRVGMVDTRTLRHLWGQSYTRSSSDVADVVDGVSSEVTEALQLRLDASDRSRLEAYGLYQKGRYYWSKRSADGLRKAVDCFNQVTRLDPSHALAYAGLANSYSLLSYYSGVSPAQSFPKAKAAALRALELDETLAEAHTALGLVLRDYDHAWADAEGEFRRAIELNPKYATAHQWYAEYLAALGRHDEAIRTMRRAQELAPLELIIAADLGWVYYLARRPDDAVAQLVQTIERDPNFAPSHWFLALAYAEKGLLGRAVASAETAVKLSAGSTRMTADLAAFNARSGNRDVAERLLQQLRDVASTGGYVSPYDLALVHVGLGDRDRAFQLLDQAVSDRRWELVNLEVDWMLDPIRTDPRFAVLVRRMGFPH